jgi:ribosomal protein S18 acetylase RimI-like enzyme
VGSRLETLRRNGARDTARKVADRARRRVLVRESHIWYVLDLAGQRPRREMPEGFVLRRGDHGDVDALDAFDGQPGAREIERRLEAGAELYLIVDAATEERAFACWIFTDRTPVAAARGGELGLPGDVACLEDSATSPDFRGRGLAPAAWTTIADDLEERGFARLITKVEESNTPSRKAVIKAGFSDGAVMHLRRTAMISRVAMTPVQITGIQFLIDSLSR